MGDVERQTDRQTWWGCRFLQFCKHPLKMISMVFCLDFVTCSFFFLGDMLACHSRTDVSSQDHRQRPISCPVIILIGQCASCIDFFRVQQQSPFSSPSNHPLKQHSSACTYVCAHTTHTLSVWPSLCIGKCFIIPLWTHVYGMPVSFAVCPVVVNWYDVHNCGNFGQIFLVPWYCWPATVLLIL